jgi:transaldolase/glucose-6-phosphate isomerase
MENNMSEKIIDEQVMFRMWAKDSSLFGTTPMLDWLTEPESLLNNLSSLEKLAHDTRKKFSYVLLLGMGGSSATAKMFKEILAPEANFYILDTIHPSAVLEVEKKIDLTKTLVIVASKSGSTMEPMLLYRHFLERLKNLTLDPYSHFMALTDPISPLEQESVEKGFLYCPLGKPGIGGRYSGLSIFGILPALLMGIDVRPLLESAVLMSKNTSFSIRPDENPAVSLAQVVADYDQENFFIYLSKSLSPMKAWLEQLLAESLGKNGHGVIPIITDDPNFPSALSFILDQEPEPSSSLNITLSSKFELGGIMFVLEMATALAGYLIGVDPFDQPNVERSKKLTEEIIKNFSNDEDLNLKESFDRNNFIPQEGDYCAVLSFLYKKPAWLLKLKQALSKSFQEAVILEEGPSYLHSSGQLYKGGPKTGHFLLLTGPYESDFLKAYGDLSMGQIHLSQALGDLKAIRETGQKINQVYLENEDDFLKLLGELCKSQ